MNAKLGKALSLGRQTLSNALFYAKLPGKILKIRGIVQQPSYYPELERKTESERWKDNFRWLMKHHELNELYTGYGLDVKDFRSPEDFVAHRDFCLERNAGVRKKQATYGNAYTDITLVRNKYIFASYIEATVGADAIPATIGLMDGDQIFLHKTREWIPVTVFCKQDFRYVFKIVDGTYGDGVRLVACENGSLRYGGAQHTPEEFIQECRGKRFLIQDLIIQHEALRAFQTSCVNTIRAITIRGKKTGKIELFAAFLRVGNDNDSFVDNRAKGGLAVGVDPETGRLMKYGFPHERFGTKTDTHPLSGIVFEGYQLPYWQETVDLIVNAHKQFPDIATIGWDVTMTDEKPVIVEANDSWEISGPQDTFGGLKERWDRLRNQ